MDRPTTSSPSELTDFKVPEAFREYLYRLIELGSVEGPVGAMAVSPEMQPLMKALHHVLAGGQVQVELVEAGDPDVVGELDARVARLTR